jgi:hypothetical protein
LSPNTVVLDDCSPVASGWYKYATVGINL